MSLPKTRKYCCICSNFRGKEVDEKTISLHRFPARCKLRRVWLQRSRLVRKDFAYTANSQMCSDHFVNRSGPSKEHPVPSVFPNKVFQTSNLESENVELVFQLNADMEQGDIAEEQSDDKADSVDVSEPFISKTESPLDISIHLHDYCGPINLNDIATSKNQSTQTNTVLRIDVSTQYDFNEMSYEYGTPVNKVTVDYGVQVNSPVLTFEDIEHDDQKFLFYTGVPNSAIFKALFDEIKDDATSQTARYGATSGKGRPRHLRLIDEFFLVLMRLRLGLLLEDLADRYNIGTSTCGLIFNKWIDYLYIQLEFLIQWPSRRAVDEHMPLCFKEKYPNCRVIIDCTELRTETPCSLQHKSLMYSDYKSHMTWKGLIGISPAGVVTFVSDLWAGSVSDKQITKDSALVDMCEPGDAIMADKGFLISDITTPKGVHLIIPPFKQKKKQFSKREVQQTRTIANLRIHVERQMERIKNFNILKTVMPLNMSQQVTKIWKICAQLTNLQPPLCKAD
ncbi:hypothetical protein ACJMK2_008524 [Sinanodonta woodiana]|uniref:THAP-type domain-containing protein n=1 Tax=Sinanodonta woodiana TaxID=1069815 RepID=A0ABD3VLV8_SINWO